MCNPYDIVRGFEAALCTYTGAKYAVTTTSCTSALLIALDLMCHNLGSKRVILPSRTYVSVPQSVKHAGHTVDYVDMDWTGAYQLKPFNIWDSARRFTSGMFVPGQMQCVSFHWTKILQIGQGGAVLHDDDAADEWLRRLRFDGRKEGVPVYIDEFSMVGHHCYMSPRDAAEGLSRLAVLPKHNSPLPNDNYPDLSKIEVLR